jgi:hypothetical protein
MVNAWEDPTLALDTTYARDSLAPPHIAAMLEACEQSLER